ncbi:hypothetical protein LTR17_026272 [Elasticomyces elasticus]|nr:hypothetical protein LTR17_026272 [Elasticomyces elasticus]
MSLHSTPPLATPLASPRTRLRPSSDQQHATTSPIASSRSSQLATPPENPDCILSLKDGSMLAASSTGVARMLEQQHLIVHSYQLPIYYVNEEPDIVHLLHAIHAGDVDSSQGMVPPMSVLYGLAKLCLRSGGDDICEAHVCQWVKRWILMSWDSLGADVLEVAMLCGNRQIVAEVCRALVLGAVSDEEVYHAEGLLEGLPDPGSESLLFSTDESVVQIGVMRATLRQALRTLLRLTIEDHPSITTAIEEPHNCATQALSLTSYLCALHRASLFPLPENDSKICLMWLSERLQAAKKELVAKKKLDRPEHQTCAQCHYIGRQWGIQLDEIAKSMNNLYGSLTKELKKHLMALIQVARESA